jgi:hypothetical protein
LVVRRFS